MNAQAAKPIATMAELLAHAIALELESAECYRALADSMAAHNNPPTAALFEEMALSAEARTASLQHRAGGKTLPELAPWEHRCAPTGGAADCMTKAHYQMTVFQALELVIRNELQSHGCLLRIAGEIAVPKLYPAAQEIAKEKERQVLLLNERLAREAAGHAAPPEDLDPPNVPE